MSLQTALLAGFNNALAMTLPLGNEVSDADVQEAVVDAIVDSIGLFITTTQWSTVYSGTSPIGVSAGTVSSTTTLVSLNTAPFKPTLSAIIDSMNTIPTPTTDQWADALTNLFVAMCAAAVVTQTLVGTVLPPVGPAVPFAGTGTGAIVALTASLTAPMRVLTAAVNGSNDSYATALSTLLKTVMSSSTAPMASDAPLAGLVGVGVNTFND